MGLDMDAFKVDEQAVNGQQVDLNFDDNKFPPERIAYWRKFNHLHGWMERLYYAKGGTAETFNCVEVRLMPEDINKLEEDWKAGNLTATEGFFFGDDKWYSQYDEYMAKFINDARDAFADGKAVFYTSWW